MTVLNGADGLSDLVTGLVGQGLAIFDTLRGEVGSTTETPHPGIESGKASPSPTTADALESSHPDQVIDQNTALLAGSTPDASCSSTVLS